MIKNNDDSLKEILESNNLKNEIDFVIKQLCKEKDCRPINQIPIAKKYNIPYGSKVAHLISIIENKE